MSGVPLPAQLEAAEGIAIAQLSPELQDPKTRVVRGVVTITWPYSIVRKNIAFLLAEADFRLRRAKGQVRVEFAGSSAKAIADAALGSGDEISLSLDGVELVADDSKTRVPGTSLDWQLRFTERVLLQAKISDSEEVKIIDVNHPAQPPEPEPEQLPVSVLEPFQDVEDVPEPVVTPAKAISSKRSADQGLGVDEFASPAFLKRARVSYGSLFDGGLDIFDEADVGAKARAKKKSRTGRYSGVWTYASRSPSPEPEAPAEDTEDTSMMEEQPTIATPSRPTMVDGACQTVEQETSPPRDVQVAAEARQDHLYWQTPSKSTMIDSGVQSDLPHSPNVGLTPLGFGPPPPMPIFTSAHEQYAPAFQQPPLGPVFGHDLQSEMEPHYGAEGPFHEHSSAYPEAGLDHALDTHGHYPAAFLDEPHFGPETVVTSQPLSGPIPTYQDHRQQPDVEAEPHHAVMVDGIAEPQQIPWGLTSAHYSRSPAKPAESAENNTEVLEGREPSPQDAPGETWADDREREVRHDPEDQEAALRVEEDQISEDRDGPEEETTARTYTERRLEAVEDDREEAAPGIGKESSPISGGGSSSESSEESDEEAEHEADDTGGDYDISNYRNLSNNQDDDDGTDLESDYGQEEDDEILDPEHGNEYDEDREEDSEDYDEDEEFDEDEDQENQPPPVAPRGGPPVVIDLLSDSEDEAPPPRPATVPQRQIPQYDGSADELEDEELYDQESQGGSVGNGDSHQVSSPQPSDAESEEGSQVGTPTPKPRQAASPAPELTTATIGDDFETMSPVKLPQMTGVPNTSYRPTSRGESDILEAELEKELEEEIAADDAQSDRQTPAPSEAKTEEAPEDHLDDTEVLPSSSFNEDPAGDATPKQVVSNPAKVDAEEETEVQREESQAAESPAATPEESSPVRPDISDVEESVDSEIETVDVPKVALGEKQTFEPEERVTDEVESQRGLDQSEAIVTEAPETVGEHAGAAEPEAIHAGNIESRQTPEVEASRVEVSEERTDKVQEVGSDDKVVPKEQSPEQTEVTVVETSEVGLEETQSVKVIGHNQPKEVTPKRIQMKETQVSTMEVEETQPQSDDSDMEVEQVDVETTIYEEIRLASPETTVEVDMEFDDDGSVDPADVEMGDLGDMSVDDFTSQAPDSDMELDDMTQEELIQSQLYEESMMLEEEQTITTSITTTHIVEERPDPEGIEAADDNHLETEVVETSRVTIETSVTEPLETIETTQQAQTEYEDAMDVDELDDAKSTEMASPTPTYQVQSQSFEEVKLVKTQVDEQITPGLTQNAETVSQSIVETQVTEETVPDDVDDDAQSQTEKVAEHLKDDGPAESPATVPVQPDELLLDEEEMASQADATSPINDEPSQIRDSSAQPSEAQSSLIADDPSEEVSAAQPTPKRGRGQQHRRTNSKDQDPSIKLARASIASRRSTRLSDRTTPDISSARVTTRGRSASLALKSDSDAEDDNTSVQLARAAIKSPSRASKATKEGNLPKEAKVKEDRQPKEPKAKEKELPKEIGSAAPAPAPAEQSSAALKAQLTRSLRSDVPDCVSLKVLRNHPGRSVDVLAVATTEPPEAKRAKGGPRGIMLAFNVTDHSVAPAQTVAVQIFRPHKAALPVVHQGDAVLLRNFSVMVLTRSGFGLRANDGSSWAVFERERRHGNHGDNDLPQIRGPPVELSEGETAYAALLRQWYAGLDAKSLARLDKANEAAPAVGKEGGK
ncbi:hypothetical protein CORC01_01937 [Colletotrichum orchidophilum]|uniref:Telomeric single stranded DNA binding POT1/Cdc13 domain-containing protein n=1 Tax=Colletotrichum orchidophilum TaxID=1209926 RepID=A0A1G4BNH6_9PEZI|nr:uncharacterized protein CORC01_01937 [Colletotrichum orchidophilum]OHF02836.1 hypothetical protein CORC01_01937 [Colletotrichum orchidophilum]